MSEEEFSYEEYADDVDLDPKNKPPSNRVERFKGETGKTYRVALMYFHPLQATIRKAFAKKAEAAGAELDMAAVKDMVSKALSKRAADYGKAVEALEPWEKLDLSSPQFKTYKSHYVEDIGSIVSRLGEDGPEADKVWSSLGEAKQYWSTVALFYPLDQSGNVDPKNIARDAFLKPWRFSRGTFKTLIEKNEMLQEFEKTLATSDLKLVCKSSQYQTFEIDPAGAALWLKSPSLKAKFLPMAYALYDKLVDARRMTTAELRKKLAELGHDTDEGRASNSGGGGAKADVATDDIEDLLENV